MSKPRDEAQSLMSFLEACEKIPQLSPLDEDTLAWYWDHNYAPQDVVRAIEI